MRCHHLLAALALSACAGGASDPADSLDTSDTSDTAAVDDTTDDTDDDSADASLVPVACEDLGGDVLRVHGQSAVLSGLPYTYDAEPRDWTIELWAEPGALPSGTDQVRLLDWSTGATDGVDAYANRAYWVVDVLGTHVPEYESRAAPTEEDEDMVSGTLSADVALRVGTWTHIAVVSDGTNGEIRMYVDGVLAGASAPPDYFETLFDAVHYFYVGGRGTMMFTGRIDEVRLWDVARTQAEIRDTLCARLTDADDVDGLRDQYTFDEGFDSMNGVTAHLVGTPHREARD